MQTRRKLLAGAASLGAPFLFEKMALAVDPYPNKAITIVIPQAPGGANDVIGRSLAQKLAISLGVPAVAENKSDALLQLDVDVKGFSENMFAG
jgi:tripartite-type tricarboxylate transporter receptor subunit TctC